jgi:hypothetical protein
VKIARAVAARRADVALRQVAYTFHRFHYPLRMNEPILTPTQASVLHLRLAEFGAKPVVEQARLRAQLEAVVAAGLSVLPEQDRIVLDAPDGIGIVVLGNTAGALEIAERCLDAAAVLPLCIGAHHGAVALAAEDDSIRGMVGDGLRSAAVAAGFAKPAQMLVTRSFRKALAAHAPVRQPELRPAGTFSDSSVRTHELFAVDRKARVHRRRRLFAIGLASMIVAIAAGVGLRMRDQIQGLFAASATLALDISPGGEVFLDGVAKGPSPPLKTVQLSAGTHTLEVRSGTFPPFKRELTLKAGEQVAVQHLFALPSVVIFEISPGGEVFVDGKARGTIPALKRLELAAGPHKLEVRYGKEPPLRLNLDLKPGEQLVVRHKFGKQPRSFWRKLFGSK